jgi:hypothetical protein
LYQSLNDALAAGLVQRILALPHAGETAETTA